jgi:Holliday junction resolvasome RuvABC endonuclease subunit
MRLLSLDLATHLGWCYGDPEAGDPVSGHHRLPSTGDEIGPFGAAYGEFLRAMLKEARPTNVVMEAPMQTTGGKTPMATMQKLQGLCYHTEVICWNHGGIDCRQVPAATWKKAFTGSGRASKSQKPYPVIVACRERGWNHVTDDNEADAIGIWVYAAGMLAPKKALRFDPLGRAGLLIA